MRRVAKILLGAMALPAFAAAAASAQTVMLSGPGDFSGSETLVTFDDLGLTNGADVTSASGVVFQLGDSAPGKYYDDAFPREFPPDGIGTVNNFWGYAFPYPDLSMLLPGVMHRVAFEARVNPGDDVRVVLMRGGEVVDEVVVPSLGSDQLYFYGYENSAGFDEVMVDAVDNASGAFTLDNVEFEALAQAPPEPVGPPVYSCDGFLSPMPPDARSHPRAQRAWERFLAKLPFHPLQARLVDADGMALGDADLAAPPVVQVLFASAKGGDPEDVTADVLGRASGAFRYGEKDQWRMWLSKRHMRGWGTYVVTLESGDASEYAVDPTCTMWVTHEPWWKRFLHHHHHH